MLGRVIPFPPTVMLGKRAPGVKGDQGGHGVPLEGFGAAAVSSKQAMHFLHFGEIGTDPEL